MRFEDLKAWQKARELMNGIYRICKIVPLKSDFGLRDQLQRAAVSAMTNLAEGFERVGEGEKLQFWNIARASAGEVKSLLYVMFATIIWPMRFPFRSCSLWPSKSAL